MSDLTAAGATPLPEGAADQTTTVEEGASRPLFAPVIDIYESDEGLVLIADLPGVSSGSVDLQVQDKKLTLFGRASRHIPPHAKLIHQEYEEGDFLRSFILSEEVDHDRIQARLTGGVLEVSLPRATQVQPRKIPVVGN